MPKTENQHWQQINWQPKIDGQIRDVPIDVLTNDQAPDVHFYGGLGEKHLATQAGVNILGELGLKTAGVYLTFDVLEPTRANIQRTIQEAPIAVVQQLNEQAGRPADTKTKLIGKSQGGGVVFTTASQAPELYGAIGSLAPVGLNREFLGSTLDERRQEFYKRLAFINLLRSEQNPLLHPGNLPAGYELGRQVISDILARFEGHSRLKAKVDLAMEMDLADDIKRLVSDHNIRIFVGEKDPIFKPFEIVQTLGQVGLTDLVETVPGSHSSTLTRTGKAQLTRVGQWIRSVE